MGTSRVIVTEVLESRMKQARKFGADELTAAVLDKKEALLQLAYAHAGLQIALSLQESLLTGVKIDCHEDGSRRKAW
jgi:threonine dehydrogenase-like Zn-dependent dehydrogenase